MNLKLSRFGLLRHLVSIKPSSNYLCPVCRGKEEYDEFMVLSKETEVRPTDDFMAGTQLAKSVWKSVDQ